MGAAVVGVTGTDSGVGKTLVTAVLARALVRAGRRVIAVKPVESGCGPDASGEDGVLLARATGQASPKHALVRLRDPVTPALAADRDGVTLDLDALAAEIRALAGDADVVLIEGAGGLLSPITWERDFSHLVRAVDPSARMLVVGADRLGTLNHVHLTLGALRQAAIAPLGVVLSAPAAPDASTGTNADALRRRLASYGIDGRIAVVPRLASADEAASHLAEVVRWI